MTLGLVLVVGAFLAFVNGANDVSRGVATLVGSGVTSLRRAVLWGAACTGLGCLAASALSGAMLSTFGEGMLAPGAAPSFAGAVASLVGAAAWVLLATRTGLPVSTTHALVGALAGVAAVAYGADAIRWTALGGKVALPLLLSPAAALGLTAVALRIRGAGTPAPARADCLCAEVVPAPAVSFAGARSALMSVAPAADVSVTVDSTEACATERPAALRLTLDHLHWFTSGAVSLARGLNDAPKIAALVLAASTLAGGTPLALRPTFALIALAMVAGSVAAGLRVTRLLAWRVTASMSHREGFYANAVTAALVGAGAIGGLPMSTTHVSASAIAGTCAGKDARALNRRVLRDVLLAWAVTVPAAAVLGIAAYAAIATTAG